VAHFPYFIANDLEQVEPPAKADAFDADVFHLLVVDRHQQRHAAFLEALNLEQPAREFLGRRPSRRHRNPQQRIAFDGCPGLKNPPEPLGMVKDDRSSTLRNVVGETRYPGAGEPTGTGDVGAPLAENGIGKLFRCVHRRLLNTPLQMLNAFINLRLYRLRLKTETDCHG
jgi:hypothetical protein